MKVPMRGTLSAGGIFSISFRRIKVPTRKKAREGERKRQALPFPLGE